MPVTQLAFIVLFCLIKAPAKYLREGGDLCIKDIRDDGKHEYTPKPILLQTNNLLPLHVPHLPEAYSKPRILNPVNFLPN